MPTHAGSSEQGYERHDKALPWLLDEFRTALREEIEAARQAASAASIELVSGRRIGARGSGFQYLFLVESALNIPDDSPADLFVPGQPRSVEATIVSVEGLTVVVSLPVDVGEFIGRARLQSDLTHLLRLLISRIEEIATTENAAGDRLLGFTSPSGEPSPFQHAWLYKEQCDAVASGLGRDITFVWGPPGTGKTVTIGTLATELHRRMRSVLLVSHTNAAVDQALLQVADKITQDELEKGLVLRLGESKEERILERPELLVETHVRRRSAELLAEKDRLIADQLAETARSAELDRLIAITEWLPQAPGEIAKWRSTLDKHDGLEMQRRAAAKRLYQFEAELDPWRQCEQDARQAILDVERVQELERDIPQRRERATKLAEELMAVKGKRSEAETLLRKAQVHVPNVRAAHDRLATLRSELPQREPLLAATDEELVQLGRSIGEGEGVLARALQANVITRRLRGLPRPDDQQRMLESLRTREERLRDARLQTAAAIEGLRAEFRDAQATIDAFGYLPDPEVQRLKTEELREQEKDLGQAAISFAEALDQAEGELRKLGDPRERFCKQNNADPLSVLQEVVRIEGLITPIRHEVETFVFQIRALAKSLQDGLAVRAHHLNLLGLAGKVLGDFAEMLGEVEAALGRGRALIGKRDTNELRSERDRVQARLGKISTRVAQIDEALKQVEHLVVAEARIVATTLTRGYKRDSIQARRFDTVILDEASMAPIPALWVVAARAEHNVVLVGDFQQLPPIKHSKHELAEKWLGRDVFEAAGVREAFLSGMQPAHCVALKEQRRMHPAISAIANRFVYDGMLRDGDGVDKDGDLLDWFAGSDPFDQPVLLVDTSKLNAWVTSVNHSGRTSRLNFLSGTICADIAHLLLRPDRAPFRLGDKPRVLLAAPYRPHARLMSVLAKDQDPVGEVLAGTAHTFQGNEAPVVIFDLVNDEPHWRVGMFGTEMEEDTKRLMNVALTRAQRRLIIVGDFKWIEQKANKSGILRRLLAFLKEHYPVVDAGDVVPAGLAARAAAIQRSTGVERERPVEPQMVVTQDRFFDHLYADLAQTHERVVIYSPFMTADRVGRLEAHLRAAVERGAEVWVVTKTLEERDRDVAGYEGIERALRAWGVRVVHKRHMHEKLIIIDDRILWQGSLNPLSFSATQEIMERRDSAAIVADYTRVLRLDDLLAPYTNMETICPYCGREVVAAEGAGEPFFWRCITNDCFSRSIGERMPVDGRVVCRKCEGTLEFRWPNENPFWRCTKNHSHRQPLARAHLRLPNMREVVPASELRRLDRKFSVSPGA